MIFSFTSNKIVFHKPGKREFTVSIIFFRYIKCYFSKNYTASFRQNPHVYFLTVSLYILLMGHFFAVSVLQSITKGWGKRCKWEYPTAYGLGVTWASSQVFLVSRWRAVVLCAFSHGAPAAQLVRRRQEHIGDVEEGVPVWPCVCVQFVRYAFTSVIKCWIWFKHIYQISISHLQMNITKSAAKSVFTGSFVC